MQFSSCNVKKLACFYGPHFLSLPTEEVWPDYVVYFSLHFYRALAASCVLYDRIEHSQGFSIFIEFLAF